MLTRLKVSGFKNLLDVDVRFGPFTCILGPNGVGKSNLFDAIHFLSLLANGSLMEAATVVRESGRKSREVMGLFYRSGGYVAPQIDFEMEILVPRIGEDDFGQIAEATNTMLRYKLSFGHRDADGGASGEQLVLLEEELEHIPSGEARAALLFPNDKAWRDSVVKGARRAPHFISTDREAGTIKKHQDGGSRGRPLSFQSDNLKRTVLAASNAAESPTILVLRREMESWLQLQLEPSSLRRSDEFTDPPHLTPAGEHLPATLDRLARGETGAKGTFYATLANRLSELVGGVRGVHAERDSARQLISAYMTFADGTSHPASSLSDGTLRFLALAILEHDPEFTGLLCLEEPENGIHPERIPAMIRLLADLAMDVDTPVGPDNPLRQVIVNTHSPACTAEAPEDSLLSAEPVIVERDGMLLPTLRLSALSGSWRANHGAPAMKKGSLLRYLTPVERQRPGGRRVADRPEVQLEMDFAREL